jgi:hypothetical protein
LLIKIGIIAKSSPRSPGDHKWVRKLSPEISFPIPVFCRLDYTFSSVLAISPYLFKLIMTASK